VRLRGWTWLAVLGAALLVVSTVVAGCTGQSARHGSHLGVGLVAGTGNPIQAAKQTLGIELRSDHLSVQYVDCIRNGRFYRGHPIIRCNVNFGDPHVVAYCSVILADRLVTSQQDPSIPCQPDRAGSKPLLFPPSP
jgi:hypothetical protein